MLYYTIDQLDELRAAELQIVVDRHRALFQDADLLEIGSGTGIQLRELSRLVRTAVGVELRSSDYRTACDVTYYDGVNLPFPDASFDLIYSSNTMEHVTDELGLHAEIRRVMRPGAVAVHVVPSSVWRIWTVAASYLTLPARIAGFLRGGRVPAVQPSGTPTGRGPVARLASLLFPPRHGEAGNRFTEWWHFRGRSWRRRFEQLGWSVESIEGGGLFYTGYLLAAALPPKRRQAIARLLGSACLVVILRPPQQAPSKS